jgi:hypothetical protein
MNLIVYAGFFMVAMRCSLVCNPLDEVGYHNSLTAGVANGVAVDQATIKSLSGRSSVNTMVARNFPFCETSSGILKSGSSGLRQSCGGNGCRVAALRNKLRGYGSNDSCYEIEWHELSYLLTVPLAYGLPVRPVASVTGDIQYFPRPGRTVGRGDRASARGERATSVRLASS